MPPRLPHASKGRLGTASLITVAGHIVEQAPGSSRGVCCLFVRQGPPVDLQLTDKSLHPLGNSPYGRKHRGGLTNGVSSNTMLEDTVNNF